mgnify:CR=1 FL=1
MSVSAVDRVVGLLERMERRESVVCVGLDPVVESMDARCRRNDPVASLESFQAGVLEAVSASACSAKFQSACYERYGWQGVRALERGMGEARERGLSVILDAKRGDIGISAAHYAAAAARAGADFVTVNGYLGPSGIEPFLEAGLGVFVLVRTSNPDSHGVQGALLASGASVAEHVAVMVRALGTKWLSERAISAVGAVVGATQAREAAALRRAMPEQMFLVPGIGAQGGGVEDLKTMTRPDAATGGGRTSLSDLGVLLTASRSVIYAKAAPGATESGAWAAPVGSAAEALRSQACAVLSPAR